MCLKKYLHAYTAILRKQNFKGYFYIDAFAGPGSLKVRGNQASDPAQQLLHEVAEHTAASTDESEYIHGSPRVALGIEHPFTDYVFVERDPNRAQQLKTLKSEFESPKVTVRVRDNDCNDYLSELLNAVKTWEMWRGVVFLDPFGMQVPWSTIEDLGKTRAIEIFINFPVGMAVQRLLKRSGQFTDAERAKLNEYFGTDEWFDLLYRHEADLMGTTVTKIDKSGDALVRWYRQRLKEVFGHVSAAREIRDNRGRPLYYLIFAGPNRTGARIANEILRQGVRRVQ